MKHLMKLIRPKHWMKNTFVFLPMFFSGMLFQTDKIWQSILVFCAYSCAASSIYCLNDIVDVEADRRHPVKCKRPLAAGLITISQAYLLMAVMLVVAVTVLLALPKGVWWKVAAIVLFYYVMNVAYCVKLKNYAIIDVCIVAFGFVLRVLAGGVAISAYLSHWILLMTFLLTLFLSFAKRRDDVLRMNETGEPPRVNTSRYNLTFINQVITITGSIMLVCYIMYTVSPEVIGRFHTDKLYLTTIPVLIGLLRYIQIAVVDEMSGDPVKVMIHDRFIQLIVLAWIAAFLFIIYI